MKKMLFIAHSKGREWGGEANRTKWGEWYEWEHAEGVLKEGEGRVVVVVNGVRREPERDSRQEWK